MNGGAMSPIFKFTSSKFRAVPGWHEPAALDLPCLVGSCSGSIERGFASADPALVEVEENDNTQRNFLSGAKPFRDSKRERLVALAAPPAYG